MRDETLPDNRLIIITLLVISTTVLMCTHRAENTQLFRIDVIVLEVLTRLIHMFFNSACLKILKKTEKIRNVSKLHSRL